MKKFFSTLLAASLMLIGTQAFAQGSINGGYLNSSQSHENGKSTNSNGFYVGGSANIALARGLGFAPGIYYSMLFNKNAAGTTFAGIDISGASSFKEHAINVPVYLNWGTDLANDTRVFVFGGPTAQYILSSTNKLSGGIGSWSADTTLDNIKDGHLNPFNVYVGGGLGVTVAAFQITVGYDYGLMNLYKGDNAAKSHRSNLKIGVGFVF